MNIIARNFLQLQANDVCVAIKVNLFESCEWYKGIQVKFSERRCCMVVEAAILTLASFWCRNI